MASQDVATADSALGSETAALCIHPHDALLCAPDVTALYLVIMICRHTVWDMPAGGMLFGVTGFIIIIITVWDIPVALLVERSQNGRSWVRFPPGPRQIFLSGMKSRSPID